MGKITSHNNQRKNPPLFVDDSQLNNQLQNPSEDGQLHRQYD